MPADPLIRVIMMQKDEGPLLSAWLSYYVRLFGASQLTICDNGSTDAYTQFLLNHAQTIGVTVINAYSRHIDFLEKGHHFSRLIKRWDKNFSYDFALPVDCDEFLAVVSDTNISADPIEIRREFKSLLGEKRAFRIGSSLFNIVNQPGWFAIDPFFTKGFVAARSLGIMDHGQHNPTSQIAPGVCPTRFTYVHWHNFPWAEMRERARRKLNPSLVDVDDQEALNRYAQHPQIPGHHLAKLLILDAKQYEKRYDGNLQVYVPWAQTPNVDHASGDESSLLFSDGRRQFAWDEAHYLKCYPELRNEPLGPLLHFMNRGWMEGRDFWQIRPSDLPV